LLKFAVVFLKKFTKNNTMKKLTLITGIGLLCSYSSMSQNDIDAMRYSQITFGGTARFSSMAGSMGALGADFSTLSFNPAGIAMYRKTELMISPALYFNRATSTFHNREAEDSKLNFNIGNLGFVGTFKMKESSPWKTVNFGFGFNRVNNFHNRTLIEGENKTSSLLDTYVNSANGSSSRDFDGFSTNLAWQTYLINPTDTINLLYDHVIKNYGQFQRKSSESSGRMGETVISFGGNYNDRLLLGATLGILTTRYFEDVTFEERDEKDTISGFEYFTLTQSLTTRGSGVNFKLGAIFKATDWLRLGAAVHTPTVLTLKDNYSSSMQSNLDNGDHYEEESPKGAFDYTITTPMRAIGSAAFIIQKRGLINVEYEYVDYSDAKLNSTPNVFSNVNSAIRSKYTSTQNIRVGGEVRLDPIAIRLGYALYGSPFAAGENKNAARTSYTAGLGYRENNYFVDFAYVLTMHQEDSYLYDPKIVDATKGKFRSSHFMITLGARF